MSLQGLQQLLAERRRIKEAEVAGKVDLLRQLNKLDAEKELIGLNLMIENVSKEQNIVTQRIIRKEEDIDAINISLNAIGGEFAQVPDVDRTVSSEKYGKTIEEQLRRRQDGLTADMLYYNQLQDKLVEATERKVQTESITKWLGTPPTVDRSGNVTIGPEDWDIQRYMEAFPDTDEALAAHLSKQFPMTDEKTAILKDVETKRLQGVTDRAYIDKQRELAEEKRIADEAFVKKERTYQEKIRGIAEIDKARELKDAIMVKAVSGTEKAPIKRTFASVIDPAGGEELTDGSYRYKYQAGDTYQEKVLTKPKTVDYPSKRAFQKERLLEQRMTESESDAIFHRKKKLRQVGLLTDLEQVFSGSEVTQAEIFEEGYTNLTKYLTGFEKSAPNFLNMHDIAILAKKNRDWLQGQPGGPARAKAYMGAMKKYFGLTFGQDDKSIDSFIEKIFIQDDKSVSQEESIKNISLLLGKEKLWTQKHFLSVLGKMDNESFTKTKDKDVQLLWDLARQQYKRKKGFDKIPKGKINELKKFSVKYVSDLYQHFQSGG